MKTEEELQEELIIQLDKLDGPLQKTVEDFLKSITKRNFAEASTKAMMLSQGLQSIGIATSMLAARTQPQKVTL